MNTSHGWLYFLSGSLITILIIVITKFADRLLEPAADDFYHWARSKFGNTSVEIKASQASSEVLAGGGWRGVAGIPNNLDVTSRIILYNPGRHSMTLEEINASFLTDASELQFIGLPQIGRLPQSVIGGRESIQAQMAMHVNLYEAFSGEAGDLEKFKNYLLSLPDKVQVRIIAKYTLAGKPHVTEQILSSSIKQDLIDTWTNFLKTNHASNEETQRLREEVIKNLIS